MNCPYPTAPASLVAMLRPKSLSTFAIAAKTCQEMPVCNLSCFIASS